MTNEKALTPVEPQRLAGPLEARAWQYIEAARADNTRRAYRSDWQDFAGWCDTHCRCSMPADPGTVALYLTDRADTLKPSSLQRRLVAISQAHQAAGHESPTKAAGVREVWKGICRTKGTAQEGKAPALTEYLLRMVAKLPEGPLGARDRALLLLGFAGGFRRSELVALTRADVEATIDGLVVSIRRSKTDQEGQSRKVGIPYGSKPATCPVRALHRWLEVAGITEGPMFRPVNRHGQILPLQLSDKAVALVVKRRADDAGLRRFGPGDAGPARAATDRRGLAATLGEVGLMNPCRHQRKAVSAPPIDGG